MVLKAKEIEINLPQLFDDLMDNEDVLTSLDKLILMRAVNRMRDAVMLSLKDYFSDDVLTTEDITSKLNGLSEDEAEKIMTTVEDKIEKKLYEKVENLFDAIFQEADEKELSVEDLLFLTVLIRYVLLGKIDKQEVLTMKVKEVLKERKETNPTDDIYR